MEGLFNKSVFYGCLIKGDARDAMQYLSRFPDQAAAYRKYEAVFEKEEYPVFKEDDALRDILLIYQQYYRDAFYLRMDAAQAEEAMKNRFLRLFHREHADLSMGELEETEIAEAFRKRSYHFLGGKTAGYWGPYIWKATEAKTYDVELPEGRHPYQVMLLDGFIAKSWLDFISFGEVSTGGWTDGDGIIHCVKASYDLEDEAFTVSLLKHEAQHAMDLSRYPRLSSEDLEYRAKLVELIYSSGRNLLEQFIHEADDSKENNGHSLAAKRITEGFAKRQRMDGGSRGALSIADIQAIAKELFVSSSEDMKRKYAKD